MNLRSQAAKDFVAAKGFETADASQLALQSEDGQNPSTPQSKERAAAADTLPTDLFLTVPDEVLVQIVTRLGAVSDLCSLSSVNRRFKASVEGCSDHWRSLFQKSYSVGVPLSPSQHRAAELATSWKKLFQSRFLAQNEVAPWEKPSPFEIQAAIEQMYITNTTIENAQNQKETCLIFLVDGSGSVTEDDFQTMTSFMLNAADLIKSTKQKDEKIYLGLLQFSNEVKVELFPAQIGASPLEVVGENNNDTNFAKDVEAANAQESAFHTAVESMVRINGGTNIAGAIQKAGQLFKTLVTTDSSINNNNINLIDEGESSNSSTPLLSKDCRKVIALLTDGRIDSFQAQEAKAITARLVDEQGNVEMHACGVGRGVDKMELLKIVEAACPAGEEAANRYLPLMVLADAPW